MAYVQIMLTSQVIYNSLHTLQQQIFKQAHAIQFSMFFNKKKLFHGCVKHADSKNYIKKIIYLILKDVYRKNT